MKTLKLITVFFGMLSISIPGYASSSFKAEEECPLYRVGGKENIGDLKTTIGNKYQINQNASYYTSYIAVDVDEGGTELHWVKEILMKIKQIVLLLLRLIKVLGICGA